MLYFISDIGNKYQWQVNEKLEFIEGVIIEIKADGSELVFCEKALDKFTCSNVHTFSFFAKQDIRIILDAILASSQTKQKENNMATKNFNIHTVAQRLIGLGFTIFGGYVRDFIAGDEPKDIDVLLTGPDTVCQFIRAFTAKDCVVEFYKPQKSSVDYDGYKHKAIQHIMRAKVLKKNSDGETEASVPVDLVVSTESMMAEIPDYTVNRLKMNNDGIYLMKDVSNFMAVMSDIKSKKLLLTMPPDYDDVSTYVSRHRMKKMVDKGYSL